MVSFQFKNGSFLAVVPENQGECRDKAQSKVLSGCIRAGQQIYYGYPYPNNVGTKAFPPVSVLP